MSISRRTLLTRLGAGAAVALSGSRLFADTVGETVGISASDSGRPAAPIRLHRNENIYGASPKAIAALREATERVAKRYPEGEADILQHRIAAMHAISAERVVLGCGSTEILRAAIDAFARPRKRIVIAEPTFERVREYARRSEIEVIGVPLTREWSHDVTAMAARADATTGLVYICNPNNPTGSLTRRDELETLLRLLPDHVYVVIDEAYHEYVGKSADYASFIDRPVNDRRLIVIRSLSKIHGLAGLRIGYAVAAAPTARTLTSQCLSDGVNAGAARAAAAALEDTEHVRRCIERNESDRQEFLNQANARMLRSVDSLTNFVMLNTGHSAAGVVAHFAKHGILVAGPVPVFDKYIRLSLGTPAEMREFWRVWDRMPGGGHAM